MCKPLVFPWTLYPVTPWYQPLDADRCEEPYPYEVPRHGGEGPEEVLPKVGFLQGEVLVGLQAGRHLRQRVGVTLVEGLFPEVFILEQTTEFAVWIQVSGSYFLLYVCAASLYLWSIDRKTKMTPLCTDQKII